MLFGRSPFGSIPLGGMASSGGVAFLLETGELLTTAGIISVFSTIRRMGSLRGEMTYTVPASEYTYTVPASPYNYTVEDLL